MEKNLGGMEIPLVLASNKAVTWLPLLREVSINRESKINPFWTADSAEQPTRGRGEGGRESSRPPPKQWVTKISLKEVLLHASYYNFDIHPFIDHIPVLNTLKAILQAWLLASMRQWYDSEGPFDGLTHAFLIWLRVFTKIYTLYMEHLNFNFAKGKIGEREHWGSLNWEPFGGLRDVDKHANEQRRLHLNKQIYKAVKLSD